MDKKQPGYSLYANKVTMNVSNYNNQSYQSIDMQNKPNFSSLPNYPRINIEESILKIDEKIDKIQYSCKSLQKSIWDPSSKKDYNPIGDLKNSQFSKHRPTHSTDGLQPNFKYCITGGNPYKEPTRQSMDSLNPDLSPVNENNVRSMTNTRYNAQDASMYVSKAQIASQQKDTETLQRRLINELNQKIEDYQDENTKLSNKVDSLTYRLNEAQRETVNNANKNSDLQKKMLDYEPLENEYMLLKDELQICKDEINFSLKPLIFKYENQFEISAIEVRSIENDLKLAEERCDKMKIDLKKINSEKIDLSRELNQERKKNINLMQEKNEHVSNGFILENQVKDLIELVKVLEADRDVYRNEKSNLIRKNELLVQRNDSMECNLSKMYSDSQVARNQKSPYTNKSPETLDQRKSEREKSEQENQDFIRMSRKEFDELENDLKSARDLLNGYVESLNKSKYQIEQKDNEISL